MEASTPERVRMLKQEIAAIYEKEARFWKTRRHFPADIQEHEKQVLRLKEIMDELSRLKTKRPNPDE